MSDDAPTACPNCFAPLATPRPRFCPECGQETTVRPPPLGEFLQQFGGAYLSTEGALWRTLKLLLARPGELTAQYLAGRRKHYVLPLRLYLTISVVVLLLLRLLATAQLEQARPEDVVTDVPRSFAIDLGVGRAGLKEGTFYCESLPAWMCRRIEQRFALEPKALVREVRALGERFVSQLGFAMFLLVPAFAAALKLAYLNRRLRYTEHLVFALHVHAFWFLMIGLTLAGQPWLTALALLAVPVYTTRAMRRVYGGRLWARLLRAAGVALAYGVTMALALGAVAIAAVVT
jgi:hypothetical protein